MLVLRDPEQASSIPNLEIRALVVERFAMVSEDEPYDPDLHGYFIVMETGDAVGDLDEQLGFSVLVSRVDGIRFGHPGFAPDFEFVEEFAGCYDMVFVLSDDGYGVEIFIPKAGTDAELLFLCARYAAPATTDSTTGPNR